MFWLIYITSSILASFLLARLSRKHYLESFTFFLVIFLTPAQIEASRLDYAPSVFTFIFNVIFQLDFSTRVLRPLFLSLSLYLVLLFLYQVIKRRFF